jgi:zinc transporter ZupT
MNIEVLLKAMIAVASAVSGAAVLFLIKLDHKKLCTLISFSAGALFGAAVFMLLPESSSSLNIIELLLSALSGYFLFWFISKYFSHVCPACSASHFDEQTTKKFSEIVLTLMVALSIHSFLDGVALSSGNFTSHGEDSSVFFAITTHKFPEGLALAALMLSANYRRTRIFFTVLLVETITLVGALAGKYLFESGVSHSIMSGVMAHIAGGFIFLASHAILGEMLRNHKNLVVISFSLGLFLILAVHFFI